MTENVSVLITEEEISGRISALAAQISKEYENESVTLVCLLKGAVSFMTDLARKLDLPAVEFDFMDVSSYEGTESTGEVKINKDLTGSIVGKNILIIEDIVDTGRTLERITQYLNSKKPKTLKVCALLSKPERRLAFGFDLSYVGFVIPNEFVVGYGLDYEQRYRNLPYIGVLSFL
ncbi:hypoxanthine phosphoribosyltransferase [Clostridia bacterium]|nr:hypoxanthine phosphoribosyltransferase [Clostridia bacterium]